MPNSVTFPVALGGDGKTYTDDTNPLTGLANGGHRLRFVPALQNIVYVGNSAATSAANAKTSENAAKSSETKAKASETTANSHRQEAADTLQSAYDIYDGIGAVDSAVDDSRMSKEAAASSEAKAKASETAAKTSETKAKASETAAKTSETAADASELLAQKWAEAPYATAVVSGKYSALHHAKVSENHRAASLQSAQDSSAARAGSEAAETRAKASETASKASENAAKASETASKASENAAEASELAADTSKAKAKEWATKTDQPVEGDLYGAKYYAERVRSEMASALQYRGTWNATTSFPAFPKQGDLWKVSVAGGVYKPGDQIVYNGSSWDHIDNTESVTSVGGNVGAITDTQLREAVKRVDGAGSGLDADLLDGKHASAFASASHNHSAGEITSGVLAYARIPTIRHGDTNFANQTLNTSSSVQHAKVRTGGAVDDGTNSLQVDGGARTDTLAAGGVQDAEESIDTDGNAQIRGEGQLKMGDFAIQYNAATQSLDFNFLGA